MAEGNFNFKAALECLFCCLVEDYLFFTSVCQWNVKENFEFVKQNMIEAGNNKDALKSLCKSVFKGNYSVICTQNKQKKLLSTFLKEIHKFSCLKSFCDCPACSSFELRGTYRLLSKNKMFKPQKYILPTKLAQEWYSGLSLSLEFHPACIIISIENKKNPKNWQKTDKLVCISNKNTSVYEIKAMTLIKNGQFCYAFKCTKDSWNLMNEGIIEKNIFLTQIFEKFSPTMLFFYKTQNSQDLDTVLLNIFINLFNLPSFTKKIQQLNGFKNSKAECFFKYCQEAANFNEKIPHMAYDYKYLINSYLNSFKKPLSSNVFDTLREVLLFFHQNHSPVNELNECDCVSCFNFLFSYEQKGKTTSEYILVQETLDFQWSTNKKLSFADLTTKGFDINLLNSSENLIIWMNFLSNQIFELKNFLNYLSLQIFTKRKTFKSYNLAGMIVKNKNNEKIDTAIFYSKNSWKLVENELNLENLNTERLLNSYIPVCLFYESGFLDYTHSNKLPIIFKDFTKDYSGIFSTITSILNFWTIKKAILNSSDEWALILSKTIKNKILNPFLQWFFNNTDGIQNVLINNPATFIHKFLKIIHKHSFCEGQNLCIACKNFEIRVQDSTNPKKKNIYKQFLYSIDLYVNVYEKKLQKNFVFMENNEFSSKKILKIVKPSKILSFTIKNVPSKEMWKNFFVNNEIFDFDESFVYKLYSVIVYLQGKYYSLLYNKEKNHWIFVQNSRVEYIFHSIKGLQVFFDQKVYYEPKILMFKRLQKTLKSKIIFGYLDILIDVLKFNENIVKNQKKFGYSNSLLNCIEKKLFETEKNSRVCETDVIKQDLNYFKAVYSSFSDTFSRVLQMMHNFVNCTTGESCIYCNYFLFTKFDNTKSFKIDLGRFEDFEKWKKDPLCELSSFPKILFFSHDSADTKNFSNFLATNEKIVKNYENKTFEYNCKYVLYQKLNKKIIFFKSEENITLKKNNCIIKNFKSPFDYKEKKYSLFGAFYYLKTYELYFPLLYSLFYVPGLEEYIKSSKFATEWGKKLQLLFEYKNEACFDDFLLCEPEKKVDIFSFFLNIHKYSDCKQTCPICISFSLRKSYYLLKKDWKIRVNLKKRSQNLALQINYLDSEYFEEFSEDFTNFKNFWNYSKLFEESNINALPMSLLFSIKYINDSFDLSSFENSKEKVLIDFVKNNESIGLMFRNSFFYYSLRLGIIDSHKKYFIKDPNNDFSEFSKVNKFHTESPLKVKNFMMFSRSKIKIEQFVIKLYEFLIDIKYIDKNIQNSHKNCADPQKSEQLSSFDLSKNFLNSLSDHFIENLTTDYVLQKIFSNTHTNQKCNNDKYCKNCELFSLNENWTYLVNFKAKKNIQERIDSEFFIFSNMLQYSKYTLIKLEYSPNCDLQNIIEFVNEYQSITFNYLNTSKTINLYHMITTEKDQHNYHSFSYNFDTKTLQLLEKNLIIQDFSQFLPEYKPIFLVYIDSSFISTTAIKLQNKETDNLCYINSSLQAIFNLKTWKKNFSRWKTDKDWVVELKNIFEINLIKQAEFNHLQKFRIFYSQSTNFLEKFSMTGYGNTEDFLAHLLQSIHENCSENDPCPACKSFKITGKSVVRNKISIIKGQNYSLTQILDSEIIKLNENVLLFSQKNKTRFLLKPPPTVLWIKLKLAANDKTHQNWKIRYIMSNLTIDYKNNDLEYKYILKSIILFGKQHYKTILYSYSKDLWVYMNDSIIEKESKNLDFDELIENSFYPSSVFYELMNTCTDSQILTTFAHNSLRILSKFNVFKFLLNKEPLNDEFFTALQGYVNGNVIEREKWMNNIVEYFQKCGTLNRFSLFFKVFLRIIHFGLCDNDELCLCPGFVTWPDGKVESKNLNKNFQIADIIFPLQNSENTRVCYYNPINILYFSKKGLEKNEEFDFSMIFDQKTLRISDFQYDLTFLVIRNKRKYTFYEYKTQPVSVIESLTIQESSEENKFKLQEFLKIHNFSLFDESIVSEINSKPYLLFYIRNEPNKNFGLIISFVKNIFYSVEDLENWKPKSLWSEKLKDFLIDDKNVFDSWKIEEIMFYYNELRLKYRFTKSLESIKGLLLFTLKLMHNFVEKTQNCDFTCPVCKFCMIKGSYFTVDEALTEDSIKNFYWNKPLFTEIINSEVIVTWVDENKLELKKNVLFYYNQSNEIYSALCNLEKIPLFLVYYLKVTSIDNKILRKFVKINEKIQYENNDFRCVYELIYLIVANSNKKNYFAISKINQEWIVYQEALQQKVLIFDYLKENDLNPEVLLYRKEIKVFIPSLIQRKNIIEKTSCKTCKRKYPYYFKDCRKCVEKLAQIEKIVT